MRKMKDSGIEWIGEIPEDWTVSRHKYIMHKEKTICEHYAGEDIISLTINGVIIRNLEAGGKMPTSFDGYQYVEPGDLLQCLFDIDVTPRCVGVVKNHGITSPAYSRFKVHKGYNNAYYDYLLRFIDDEKIFVHLSKNLRSSLTETDFGALPTIVPPFNEQKNIASFLDSQCLRIDAVLEKTRASIEEYKKLKQAVITQAVTQDIRGERSMKDSGIEWAKKIPEEWESVNPKALFSQRKDKAFPGERQLTASQQHGVIYQDEFMKITGNKVVTVEKDFDILKHVEVGDFVISMRSFQGGLEYSTNAGCISSAYVMLIPNLELVFPRFYRWLLKSSVYINALQSTSNMVRDGQAMRYSNFAQVRLYKVPLNEQKEIADYLDKKCSEIDKLIAEKERFIAEMESYKKSLIYEYVTGKKEVPKASNDAVALSPIFYKALLATRILDLLDDESKGRIQLQKILYISECMNDLKINTEFLRVKHGPMDSCLHEVEEEMYKRGWYQTVNGSPVVYKKLDDFAEYYEEYNKYFANYDAEIKRIVSFIRPMKTSQAERVATLLAAWNDFILEGNHNPSDHEIIEEIRTNWHSHKANSPESTWQDTLNKIRRNGFKPFGYGLRTQHG